jgi:hypothetical protein
MTTWQYNVEARIQGYTYPEKEVLLMGHYDSYINASEGDPMLIAPGANDNASGVAAIMECARVIMQEGYEPKQTIIFLATAGEELMYSGDSGAKHYAGQAAIDNRNIGLVMNNDMIAWDNGTWTISLMHNSQSERHAALVLHVIENYTSLNYIFPDFWTYADLTYFYDNGFQGIYFMENFTPSFYPYYHTINDIVDNLDTAYHAEITRLNLGTIMVYDNLAIDAALEEIIGLPHASCTGSISPVIRIHNYGLDTISSMDITCQINSQQLLTYEWNGTLLSGGEMLLELPEFNFNVLPQNELEVTLENVNGAEDQIPVNNSRSKTFGKAMATPDEVKLFLRLDQNPEEITWEITDAVGNILYSGGPYSTPLAIINETMVLNDEGCYTFSIYDEGGEGLQVPGFFVFYYGSNTQIMTGSGFGTMAMTEFDVGGTMYVSDTRPNEKLHIFPNPANDQLTLAYEPMTSTAVYRMYNTLGNMVAKGEIYNHKTVLHIALLPSGIYVLVVEENGWVYRAKVVKQ